MKRNTIIEEMGGLFEDFGVNPILGRIFGTLLVSEDAQSLNEIAELLSLSKAAVSIQIRKLEELGYCQKLPKTKNRQHFYILKKNYLETVYRKRIEKEKLYLAMFESFTIPESKTSKIIKDRISNFKTFNNFMIEYQLNAIKEWQKEKKNES